MPGFVVAATTPTVTFSMLPLELRRKIWLASFESRTLSLSMRRFRTSAADGQGGIYIQTFDVQLGLHIDQLTDEEARRKHSLKPPFIFEGNSIFRDCTRIKPPPGPVALEVCSESRGIALENHELMFRGSLHYADNSKSLDAAFEASGWGQPRTWVNPKLDLIFLSYMGRSLISLENRVAPVDPQTFYERCPEESARVQRVGIMFHNYDDSIFKMIRMYTKMKELVVYLTDRAEARGPTAAVLGIKNLVEIPEILAADAVEEILEEHKTEHNNSLASRPYRKEDEIWATEIPNVRISHEVKWYKKENGELALKLASPADRGDNSFTSP